MGERVISADNHLIDPKDLYVERMPKEFRYRAPEYCAVRTAATAGASMASRRRARSGSRRWPASPIDQGNYRSTGMKWDEILPGNYDGAAHLADMDKTGCTARSSTRLVAMNAYTQPDRGVPAAP